jgi:L-lactate dehydrogenase complex protein LldF
MANHQTVDFEKNVSRALNDAQLRKNFKFAMGNFVVRRRTIFPDAIETEKLRATGNAIKKRALNKLPELLEQLEKKCTQNGIRVHWAETTDEANQQVLKIMQDHNATRMVKGKSMVSEEMHLNKFLQENLSSS